MLWAWSAYILATELDSEMSTPNVSTFTWESDLRHPRHFLRTSLSDLKRSLELAIRIFSRDLRAQYRETLLGLIWLWVPALSVSGSFLLAQQANLISVDATGIPYPAYVLISTILWQLFAETLAAPVRAIESAKPLLAKVRFPAESMILAKLMEVLLGFAVKLPLIIGVMIYFKIQPTWEILAAPVGLFALLALGLFVGMALVPVGGLYQDVGRSIPIAMTFLMFLTPVVFSPDIGGTLGAIVRVNPVTYPLVTTRALITGMPVTDWAPFGLVLGLSLFGLLASWLVVRISIPILVERAGN